MAGAAGPALAGILSDATGDRRWGAVLCAAAALAGLLVFATSRGDVAPDASTAI